MSTQKNDTRFTLTLVVVMFALLGLWWWTTKHFWPDKPPQPKPPAEQVEKEEENNEKPPVAEKAKKPEPVPEVRVNPEIVTLGAPGSNLTVKIDPKGAGVRQVVLNYFQAAAPETGQPEWEEGAGRKKMKPLELIPEDGNREVGSFLLYHYPEPRGEDYPIDTLGQVEWTRVEPREYKETDPPVQKAVFEKTIDGVKITKTYTLEPRSYHIGLEVKLQLVSGTVERPFRYQLTGGHGLPIEGQWYTGVYRNVLIGQVDEKDNVERKLQELREISHKGGGDEVVRGDKPIRYAMTANQFFASGIAVATRDQEDRDFLGQARPILLSAATKVKIDRPPPDGKDLDTIEIDSRDSSGNTYTFFCDKADVKEEDWKRFTSTLVAGAEVIIVHRSVIDRSGKSRELITNVLDPDQTAPIFHDDVSVEVSTPRDGRIIRLRPGGKPVVHKYVLYNGPVKVRLLNHLKLAEAVGDDPAGAPAANPDDVNYYLNDLRLDTLTDYPTNWMGRAFSTIGLTQLVIWFTNRMHDILWWIYSVMKFLPEVVVYGMCILLLTVLVRGIMHPLSRKQARTTLRMQSLQPELVKLKEKFKDDKQAMQMAQMELYRKHGINPLGSCWLMMLQMPVFLGLYYCLQESVHFRLAPFLWIKSLTAPDMLIHWGDKIPFISKWDSYGALYYLGPYFNVLPVIAVALMIVQQKLTLPPPADEQAAMQQKMMKYMMIFFGLMFYKVAAGLCLYFIASSLWGFAERKMLPKKKPGDTTPEPVAEGRPSFMQRILKRMMEAQQQQGGRTGNGATAAPPPGAAPGGRAKRKRGRGAPASPATEQTGLLARVRAWWAEVRRQAEKK